MSNALWCRMYLRIPHAARDFVNALWRSHAERRRRGFARDYQLDSFFPNRIARISLGTIQTSCIRLLIFELMFRREEIDNSFVGENILLPAIIYRYYSKLFIQTWM